MRIEQSTFNSIIQVSCILSMLGATVVALSWAYPVANRRKHGRILLLWLSLADFGSSLIYFIQTFSLSVPGRGIFCKVMALFGIFFPVASFLWTDAIAYYLYSVIVYSHFYSDLEWEMLLKKFHYVVWGISLIIVTVIASFNREGRSDSVSNTGGWCWIYGSNDTGLLTWEIVGGKCIEWLSCFILLPYFYAYAGHKLWKHDNVSNGAITSNNSSNNNQIVLNNVTENNSTSDNNINTNNNTDNEKAGKGSVNDYSIHSTSGLHNQAYTSLNRNNRQSNERVDMQPSISSRPPARFGKFYRKMAILPVAFFLMRLPGSLLIFTNYFKVSRQTNQILQIFQSIFDPLQGFINALVFVLGSEDGYSQAVLSIGFFIKNNLSCFSCFDRLGDYIISTQLSNTSVINKAYRANIINHINPQNEASESLLYSESLMSSSYVSSDALSIAKSNSNQNLQSEVDSHDPFED